jgi:hypothetical protein
MHPRPTRRPPEPVRQRYGSAFPLAATLGLFLAVAPAQGNQQGTAVPASATKEPTLEEVRLARGKWIETQQIIAKERADWQQGREHLLGRLELIKKEVATLEEGIGDSEKKVAESDRKHEQMVAENEKLKSSGQQLTDAATGMEQKLRVLWKTLPEPLQTKVQPLFQRMPEDPAKSRASFPERFQNVLAALSAINGANNEISVSYEVHKLAGGRPAEVKVLYAGLGQAWYMSANGEAGIGRPAPDGWKWEAADDLAGPMVKALEVLDGKQSPAFVPLPVRIR